MYNGRPVSYTHLLLQRDDVEIKWYGSRSYIDQKYASIYQNMFKIVDDKCMAVSYTHLDVYKRQGLKRFEPADD